MTKTKYGIKADRPKTKPNPKLPTRKSLLQDVLLLILGIPFRSQIKGPRLKAEGFLVAQPGLIPAMQLCLSLVNRPAEGDIHRLHHIIDNRHQEQVPDKSRSPGSVGANT